ncbi:MAG TPA: hypothetical protein VKE24_00990 [Candidatus Acidoferrales bacterium]|nr:hypothetical protein [Candidatus Acidoferrales bacterium]
MAIYAIDLTAVVALNPFFKFDGYWLLVDLSGLVNLQRRAFSLWKELLPWIFNKRIPPTLESISGRGRKILLLAYASFLGVTFVAALPFLLRRVPWAMRGLQDSVLGLPQAFRHGPEVAALAVGHFLGALLFWVFFGRMAAALISRLVISAARVSRNR